jgi:hypothetical protein
LLDQLLDAKHEPARQVNPDISRETSDFLDRLLAKESDERFADWHAVKRRLSEIIQDLPEEERKRSRGLVPVKWLAVVLGTLVILGLCIWLLGTFL